MAVRTDIILDADGDFPIANNTPIGYSDRQHVADNFVSMIGWWKQFPTNGIGIAKYLKSSGNALLELKRVVRIQLNADGYSIGTQPYTIVNNTLIINPQDISRI